MLLVLAQVTLVVSAIFWTRDVETALAAEKEMPGEVGKAAQSTVDELMKIIDLVRGSLTKLNRATLSALVVMDVHARDVTRSLADSGVSEASDFQWTSQLRMYWEEETVPVRMMNASIEYGYEYLGNSGRLVVTPLTDRCYRTLMGAIHLNLGGAPEGPAGTGKTETTKVRISLNYEPNRQRWSRLSSRGAEEAFH
jgi:dynein heavy chain